MEILKQLVYILVLVNAGRSFVGEHLQSNFGRHGSLGPRDVLRDHITWTQIQNKYSYKGAFTSVNQVLRGCSFIAWVKAIYPLRSKRGKSI